MTARQRIYDVAMSRNWTLAERAERTGILGELDEYRKDDAVLRVWFGLRGAVRKAFSREGNRDWFEYNSTRPL